VIRFFSFNPLTYFSISALLVLALTAVVFLGIGHKGKVISGTAPGTAEFTAIVPQWIRRRDRLNIPDIATGISYYLQYNTYRNYISFDVAESDVNSWASENSVILSEIKSTCEISWIEPDGIERRVLIDNGLTSEPNCEAEERNQYIVYDRVAFRCYFWTPGVSH
jgi:hypothetical protein